MSYRKKVEVFRAQRWALGTTVGVAAALGLWAAIHRVPWLGPLLADSGRAVVGPAAIARAEDAAYGLDDRWQRFWRQNETPTTYWDVPSAIASAEPAGDECYAVVPASAPLADQPTFPPPDVGPVHETMQALGDGVWVPIVPQGSPGGPPVLAKTLLHPDEQRSWSAVAIVAIDLENTDLYLKAGEYVPEATEPDARGMERPGLVPTEHQEGLIAAFNGGFKTIHGRLGMNVDGVTLIRPRSSACTVARFDSGAVRIATWTQLLPEATEIEWYRQTPRCLVENGQRADGLDNQHLADWGSGVSGSTIIRRSALGISRDNRTVFYALGESTSAAHIALALTHVGAVTVAQLDVNGTLPKFLTYDHVGPERKPVPRGLINTLTFTRDEFVRERAPRDFFYVTRPRVSRT